MSSKEYDICVFGVTGFTGERVLKYLASVVGSSKKFVAAGRNQEKLERVIQKLGLTCEIISGVDANVEPSVVNMTSKCHILLNCVGPYRYTGEVVVKACIATKTNYLDVCGEPEFMERIAYQYQQQVKEAGIHVASAVGFDSVPADFAVLFAKQQFQPPSIPYRVESYLTVLTSKYGLRGNYATWESAIQGFGSYESLKRLRSKAKKDGLIHVTSIPGPKPPKQSQARYDKHLSSWIFPFPGADAAVVRRSEAYFAQKGKNPIYYSANVSIPSTFFAFVMAFMGLIIFTLAKFQWGRSVLLKYPSFFTWGVFQKTSPSEQHIQNTRFEKTLFVTGYSNGPPKDNNQKPDKEICIKVRGPEMGYVTTPITIVQSAITLLEEKDKLPEFGVYTPAGLFSETSLLDRLQSNGITFQVE
eukprot:TRINITY_DN8144_c0_g1_i6.p1 TRINITY_DN8144_c0_g1~~TRINITY_DN8144_c0_g1_i6.p1  ORF type:complete len:415 (+),score=37.65 TRINITY_DN8144_c0_g1_i6:171-1415(+)